MIRLITLFVVLGLPAIVAAKPAAIEIVLDASGAMLATGVEDSPIHATTREAVIAVVAELTALEPGLVVGLRTAGGGSTSGDMESCSVPGIALPVAAVNPELWVRTLDAIEPRGMRPLIEAVVSAVDDLKTVLGNRRVVVITSGGDQCGASILQVATALAASDRPTELRMVGLGLDQDILDRFGTVPTRNVTNAEELVNALRWAVLDIDDGPRSTGTLRLEIDTSDTQPLNARIRFDELATGESHTELVTADSRIELPAGRYRLTVEPTTGGRHEYRDLLVLAETDAVVSLDLDPEPSMSAGIATDSPIAGAQTWIDTAGIAPETDLLFVDANGLAVSRMEDPTANDGWTLLPPVAGPLDLLLVGPVSGGVRRVLSRHSAIVVSGGPSLTAPDEVETGEGISVSLSGFPTDGDLVGLVPRDGTPSDLLSCTTIDGATEVRLAAPITDAELDLIYVIGTSMAVAARHPLNVIAPKVTLAAPDGVTAGENIEIAWSGPEGDEDFLSLALSGTPDGAYLEWARAEEGNPTVFRAPDSPGAYEVRYMDGESGEALERVSIEVTAIAVELRVTATARAGLRVEVHWTGPASPGDFLTISQPGAPPHRYLDWASITAGSPLTLRAPAEPGTYEVRYVTGGGAEVLASSTIEVQR